MKTGKFAPVYFLHGPESYFIDLVTDHIEANALAPAERSFNQTIYYGRDVDAKTVIDTAYRFPMMAPRQVVIVKEAQEMRSLKNLETYLKKPVESTVLVLAHKHKNFNTNTKFGKLLKQKAVILHAKPLYDNQVPDWITAYLRRRKYPIQARAAALLAEYLGTDLAKIANELEKLIINVAAGTEINTDHVEQNVGISKDYNVFELQRALGQRDGAKVSRMMMYFQANPRKNPLVMVIGTLYNFFSKVYMYHFVRQQSDQQILKALGLRSAWFLREYKAAAKNFNHRRCERVMALLREYDLKAKGVDFNLTNNPESELMRELLWKILHVEQLPAESNLPTLG